MRPVVVLVLGVGLLSCGKERQQTNVPKDAPASVKPVEAPAETTSPDLLRLCREASALLKAPRDQRAARWHTVLRGMEDSEMREMFDAIRSADGQYVLARQIAKEAGYPAWECPALAKLYDSMY